ncbi:MAG: hypothetical protein Q4B80_01670 [Aerococcaceae bacterium]|nr:hypothetical protein [Aerococcaceae bacterium]
MNNFETKKKIVLSGNSKLFKQWEKFGKVTQEEFLEALEWVCADPLDEAGLMTREVGLVGIGYIDYDGEIKFNTSPQIVKMKRNYQFINLYLANSQKEFAYFTVYGERGFTKKIHPSMRFNCLDRV